VSIQGYKRTAKPLALRTSIPQPGTNPLLSQRTLKFSHRTDDLKHEPA
jgi:hypothetical protein